MTARHEQIFTDPITEALLIYFIHPMSNFFTASSWIEFVKQIYVYENMCLSPLRILHQKKVKTRIVQQAMFTVLVSLNESFINVGIGSP